MIMNTPATYRSVQQLCLTKLLLMIFLTGASAALLLPNITEAAVTFDVVNPDSTGTTCAGCTSLQWNHTVSGSNTLLVVGVVGAAFDPITITSVTFNGDPLTLAGSQNPGTPGNDGLIALYYRVAPDDGMHTVEVQAQQNFPDNDPVDHIIAGSLSFNGVDQTTPMQNADSSFGNSGTASLSVTSAVGNMPVVVVGAGSNLSSPTQTGRWLRNVNTNYTSANAAQSTADGASSVAFSYTVNNDTWAVVGMDVVAAAEAAGVSRVIRLRGNIHLRGTVILK
jgi:hypothetical protein